MAKATCFQASQASGYVQGLPSYLAGKKRVLIGMEGNMTGSRPQILHRNKVGEREQGNDGKVQRRRKQGMAIRGRNKGGTKARQENCCIELRSQRWKVCAILNQQHQGNFLISSKLRTLGSEILLVHMESTYGVLSSSPPEQRTG
eukprot:1146041-Pelagomonas_calceolata.AAC.28